MKTIVTFGLMLLVASIALGGMINSVYAQDDPMILLNIAKRAQDQIHNQISADSSDKVKKLFEKGSQEVKTLEEALRNDDLRSAQEHFLSAMKLFTEVSRQLTTSNDSSQTETHSVKTDIEDPSNDLQRLQGYINSLKTIAKKHNATIDFSKIDELFSKARQHISDHQLALASENLHEIKETIAEVTKELREEASKQESQRAKEYVQKYLERLDRLIENAKKQGVADEIIEKLEASKENLSSTDNPNEIVSEIRKIISIQDKFELTNNDELESRILQADKTLSRLSQIDDNEIDKKALTDAQNTLQIIKNYLSEGEIDTANDLLITLTKQLQEIKNSL